VKILATARLSLREMEERDAEFLVQLLNEPSFIANIGDRGVRTHADALAYMVKGPLASYARNGYGLFIVERLEDGVPIGMCGLVRRDGLEDTDIGFALRPEFWSQGFAIEAATGVRDWALGKVGLTRLVAIVMPGNLPSIKVLERLAFRFEGLIRLTEDGDELKLYAYGADA
jgi:RimJ/RimL family protein N-acetyltransferase